MARGTSARTDLRELDKKLNWMAWVAFFVMWGATFLLQRLVGVDVRNLQYAAVGVILLVLNGSRYARGIPMSRLTVVIGFLALLGGAVRQMNGELDLIPILLITAGSLLLTQGVILLERR